VAGKAHNAEGHQVRGGQSGPAQEDVESGGHGDTDHESDA
jgi:hypothetical protein